MHLKEYYRRLDGIDFLNRAGESSFYQVLGYNIYINYYFGKIRFFVEEADNYDQALSFEEVMPYLPEEVLTKFLFHLDVFR